MNGNPLKRLAELDIKSLAEFRREILAAMILAAFGFFYLQFIHTPGTSELASLEARAGGIRAETERIASEVASIDALRGTLAEEKGRLASLTARLTTLRERLPSDKQVSQILADLTGTEFNRGVRIVSIRPLEPEVDGELTRLPFQISLDGGFMEFGRYLESLERMPRVMVVDNFMLERREEAPAGAAPAGGDTEGGGRPLSSQLYLSTYILGN